jgi:hypothetical protein
MCRLPFGRPQIFRNRGPQIFPEPSGPMILANRWPHEGGDFAESRPHDAGDRRKRTAPVTGPHISPHTPAQPRSQTRTARVAPDPTSGRTTACPGSIGPRAQVRPETSTCPTTAIPRSLVDGSRGSRPIYPGFVVQPVDPLGRTGPVPSSQRAGPVFAQDGSLGRTRRFSDSTSRLSAPTRRPLDRTKTSLGKEHDPPSSPERLDRHDRQAPDLQDKYSSCAVMRSTLSTRATGIAPPHDVDPRLHEPVLSDCVARPVPRPNLDRRIHNPAFSLHGTRPLRP